MLFVCLAKSKKHGGRCIAGVEVEAAGAGHRVVRIGSEPRWIRPVSATDHGEVPEGLVSDVRLLDIVEFRGARRVPRSYQSENVTLGVRQPQVVRRLGRTRRLLDLFVTSRAGPLFGNHGRAIPAERIDELDHSLLLISAQDVAFEMTESARGTPQLRSRFRYRGREYDFPVTDPEFQTAFSEGAVPPVAAECYMTLSVGLGLKGWYYKLVAGVFLL